MGGRIVQATIPALGTRSTPLVSSTARLELLGRRTSPSVLLKKMAQKNIRRSFLQFSSVLLKKAPPKRGKRLPSAHYLKDFLQLH